MALRDVTNTQHVAARPSLSRPPKLGASGPSAHHTSSHGLHHLTKPVAGAVASAAISASGDFYSRSGSGEFACRSAGGASSTVSTRASFSTPSALEDFLPPDEAADPQEVAEYVPDIYSNLIREESIRLPRPEYMEGQPDINTRFRATLIDWLIEVQMKYRLKMETVFLTVNIIDRYLEKRRVSRTKLQLVGVSSMLIAAKFEEIYPPEIRDFVYITDNAYAKQDILSMELSILGALEFHIAVPTAAHFFERYQRVNRCSEQHRFLLQYVLELSLPEYGMIRYSPSHMTAAATFLTNKLMKQHPSWPPQMVSCTRHTEQMMKACAKDMCGILEAAERSPLEAVRRKFSSEKYLAVAKMVF